MEKMCIRDSREGIVIDTRFNGGGRLHEDIEILFSGKKYFTPVSYTHLDVYKRQVQNHCH